MVIKNSSFVREIVNERIDILYNLAKEMQGTDPDLSTKYVKLIRQLSRHYKVSLPSDFKRNVCRKCNSVLVPGKNSTVRLASSKHYVVIKCLGCGSEMHVHY